MESQNVDLDELENGKSIDINFPRLSLPVYTQVQSAVKSNKSQKATGRIF